jgi:DNA-binding transcriptional ArsR family regulator
MWDINCRVNQFLVKTFLLSFFNREQSSTEKLESWKMSNNEEKVNSNQGKLTEDGNHIDSSFINEDEIFKTLNHPIRRKIIKIIALKSKLTFSSLLKDLDKDGKIDSPTLSYHLKTLQNILIVDKGYYSLTELGNAVLSVLGKTDQQVKIKWYRKRFLYAYIFTVACWVAAETLVPFLYFAELNNLNLMWIQIVVTIISVINFILVWKLRGKS